MNENPKSKRVAARFALTAMTLSLALFAIACQSIMPKGPKPHFVSIHGSPEATALSIPVYVGPANEFFYKDMMGDVKTWLDNTNRPPEVIKSFTLMTMTNSTTPTTNMILVRDRYWDVWRGQKKADHLVVIADLPRNRGPFDTDPKNDKRRVLIPLDRKLWRNGIGGSVKNPIHVVITPEEVKLVEVPGR